MESSGDGVRTHRSGRLNRDRIQRAGISSIESRNPYISPLNANSLLVAAKQKASRPPPSQKN